MMDALQEAKDILQWVDEGNVGVDNFYLALAQTYAAIAEVEQLKRIADALHVEIRGEQIQITDVLHAVYEALEDRNKVEE